MARQHITEQSHARKYWTQVPNLIDDSDLDPYARTLYLHYLRMSGQKDSYEETIRESAERCRMSRGAVVTARQVLIDQAWIEMEISGRGRGAVHRIRVLDRWQENMQAYAAPPETEECPGPGHLAEKPEDCPGPGQNVRHPDNSEGNVRVVAGNVRDPDILNSAPFKELKEPETKEREEARGPARESGKDGPVVRRSCERCGDALPGPILRSPGELSRDDFCSQCWLIGQRAAKAAHPELTLRGLGQRLVVEAMPPHPPPELEPVNSREPAGVT